MRNNFLEFMTTTTIFACLPRITLTRLLILLIKLLLSKTNVSYLTSVRFFYYNNDTNWCPAVQVRCSNSNNHTL